jgi:hypothetical protein
MTYTDPITTPAEAEAFLWQLYDAGLSFHPEDDAATIVRADGAPLFSPADATAVNERMAEVFEQLADPCAYLLGLIEAADR